jgi:hypothetical protein
VTTSNKIPAQLVSEAGVLSFNEGLTIREAILKVTRTYSDETGADYNSTVTAVFHYNAWKNGVAGPPPGVAA